MKKTQATGGKDADVHRIRRSRFTRDDLELTLLSLPAALWFIAFCYVPLFGIVFAFKNYKVKAGKGFLYSLFVHSKWVGFRNFAFLFRSPDLAVILRNTIGYNLAFLLIGVTVPVALAIMLTQLHSRRLAKACQTAIFLPHFLSWVVISYFVFAFLSTDKGMMNSLLQLFGHPGILWYQDTRPWPALLILINTWKTFGYSMVVYLASIAGIDQSLYESAVIDGATRWQQARWITLPLLRPIMSILFILNVSHILSTDFGLFFQVPRDSSQLMDVTQTLDVYVYKALMQNNNYNFASAAGLVQSVAGCLLMIAANRIVRRIDPESGLF